MQASAQQLTAIYKARGVRIEVNIGRHHPMTFARRSAQQFAVPVQRTPDDQELTTARARRRSWFPCTRYRDDSSLSDDQDLVASSQN